MIQSFSVYHMLLGKFLIINIVISCVESCLLTPSVFFKKKIKKIPKKFA